MDDIFDFFDAFLGQLGNVDQPFFARQDFDEGAEVHDARDFADIGLADFNVFRQFFDPFFGFLAAFAIDSGNVYQARIIDVDLSTCFFGNLFDHLAARPDDVADLIRLDVHGDDARSIRRELLSRFVDDLQHLAHDMHPAFMSLFQSLGQDFAAKAFDLDIHLDSRDTFHRTGDFKVHVAQSIFHALDIRQDGEVITFGNQAHGDAGNRRFDRYACIHQGQGAAADTAHGAGAIRFEDFRYDADSIGEFFFTGHDLGQCAFCQFAVADFTTARTAGRLRFADAEGREIVVVHVAAIRFQADAVDVLAFRQRSQGAEAHDLRLAAGEQACAVSAGKEADFAADRTDFVDTAAVRTDLVDSDHVADDFLDHLLRDFSDIIGVVRINVGKVFVNIRFDSIHLFFAFDFVSREDSRLHGFFAISMDGFDNIGRRFFFDEFLFRYGNLVEEAELEFDDFLDFFVGEHDGIQDLFFRDFVSAAFNHEDGVFRTGDDDVHIALFALGDGRVDDELAIDAADADTGNRAGKGNVGHAQRYGGTDHSGDFRSVVMVYAEIISHDVDVMTVCLREERTDRTVDETGEEGCRFRRFAFAFDEAARNLADGVHLFFIIDGEREKVCVFTRFFRARSRDENGGVAITDQCGTAGLLSQFTDFNYQRAAGEIHLEFLFFHCYLLEFTGDRH